MWNKEISVSYINSHAEGSSLGKCAEYVRKAVEAGGVTIRIPRPRIGNSASACDYGPSLVAIGFRPVFTYTGNGPTGTTSITGQQVGDVVVIQPIAGHPHGHIALYNGQKWVSDFVQQVGFYPGSSYRNAKPAYILYRYGAQEETKETSPDKTQLNKICYPVAKMSGQEFTQLEEILAHLEGESTGTYMIGRNGMWHGGIHITNATTPWCALSGKAASEKIDFPVTYEGEQAVRCMVDGEVVAYRICKDYMQIPWESGPLHCSGSFVLVRHYLQPGKTEKSGLHFYTLYMHLAPYSAYETEQEDKLWEVQDKLTAYDPEWGKTGKESKQASDSFRKSTVPKGAIIEWNPADTSRHATAYNQRGYGLVTFKGLSDEAQKKGVKTSLTPGSQYWMLVDKKNIAPATLGVPRPYWWKKLLPPAKEIMQFDKVVCPTPYAISAGDSVGHLGYFQVAKDGGYEARYQVHIECISMDNNLPEFLKNPEKVGEKNPLWLKYSPGLELYKKDAQTGTFNKDGRTTPRSGILTLSKVSSETDKSSKVEYWNLAPENGYVPKVKGGAELLSQYDLAKLGFKTEISEPASFDYLNGKMQPTGLIRNVFQSQLDAAKDDTRVSHALVPFNYQRLLNKIDSGAKEYSPMEYLRALHNPSYRGVVQKIIVKHPSDWYYSKSDAIWQTFLDPLKKEAPEWKKYSEAFLDKMAWMQDVTTEKLGPSLWHMHPVMFLGALNVISTGSITIEMILAANLGEGKAQCEKILPYMNKYAQVYEITNKKEIAHFLSQIGHESQFRVIEESLSYSPKRMREVYGCKGGAKNYVKSADACSLGKLRDKLWSQESYYSSNPKNLGNYVYEKRMGNGPESSGDGYKYRGRGMIQLTGKDSYQSFTNTHNQMNIGDAKDFVRNPDLIVSEVEYGVESAFSFWVKKTNKEGEHLTTVAKSGSVFDVTQIVNGGQNGYTDRKKRYNKVAILLGLKVEE